jgi:transcriptional regulator with XRE-family HTH domain
MNNPRSYEDELASWLMLLREEKGMSQEALGVQLGKGQSDIAKIENGSKRVSVIELLAWMAALDIPYERMSTILKPIYTGISGKKDI